MSPFAEVSQGIKEISNWLWPIAISMAAVGTLSMALIQFVKDLAGWRQNFQTARIRKWLCDKAEKFSARARGFEQPQQYLTWEFKPSDEDVRRSLTD